MDIDDLVPLDFSKKVTPPVSGDLLWNEENKTQFVLNEQQLRSIFRRESSDHLYVVSYIPRENRGKQPVADGILVDLPGTLGPPCDASKPRWPRIQIVPTWRPNHMFMVDAYKASIAMIPESEPEYTEAMHKAKEKPRIGSMVEFEGFSVPIVGVTTSGWPIFELPNGTVDSFNEKSYYTPVKSEEKKLYAALLKALQNAKRSGPVGTYQDTIDSLLASKELAISLKSKEK